MELYVGDTWFPTDSLTDLTTTATACKAGSLKLSCTGGFDRITADRQIIRLTDGSETVFRGRVLSASRKTAGVMSVVCEGELSFLNDSMTAGTERTGEAGALMRSLLAEHNANVSAFQQLSEGTMASHYIITVKGSTDDEVPSMEIANRITEESGIWVSADNGVLNLRGIPLNAQEIRYGENLVSFRREMRFDDIVTRIYAYGEDSEGNRITMDVPYVQDDAAIAQYGIIAKCMTFRANSAAELERKARAALCTMHRMTVTVEAVDMHWKDASVPRFRPGNVHIISPPDDFDGILTLQEVTQDWLHPGKNTIRIGAKTGVF